MNINRNKISSIIEPIFTSICLLFLIFYSLVNFAVDRNSESRIGDKAFNNKEINLYFIRETLVILMIIFVIWSLFKPTPLLKLIRRSIVIFVFFLIPTCVIFGITFKLLRIF